jgi:hypothetical protein
MLLNEYEILIEFVFRKIRNIRNLGNVYMRGPHIVMSRTDAQNELFFGPISAKFRFRKFFLTPLFISKNRYALRTCG